MTTMSDWYKDKVGIVLYLPREHYKAQLKYLLQCMESQDNWEYERCIDDVTEEEIAFRHLIRLEVEGALKEEPEDDEPITRFVLPDDELFPEPDDDNDRSSAPNGRGNISDRNNGS